MKKILFTCPRENTVDLMVAVWNIGSWKNWNYSHCACIYEVEWFFKPTSWANPAIWEVWKLEKVEEHMVQTICDDELMDEVIAVIKANHPYETPHIEVLDVDLV